MARIPSDYHMATKADVSTTGNTYETVLTYTGAGKVSGISIATLNAQKTKCIVEVTVDGGTLTEIDAATHMAVVNTGDLWGGSASATNSVFPVDIQFKTSILIRAKNDTDTNAIGGSVAYHKDQ